MAQQKKQENLGLQLLKSEAIIKQLQNECLRAKYNLFPDADSWARNYYGFACVEECHAEEDRVNAISNGLIKFTFESHQYMHFTLDGCNKIFHSSSTDPYKGVSKAVKKAVKEYEQMVNTFHVMQQDIDRLHQVHTKDTFTNMNNSEVETYIDKVCKHLIEYTEAYYIPEARDFYNQFLRSSFGLDFFWIEVCIDECSRLYLKVHNTVTNSVATISFRIRGGISKAIIKEWHIIINNKKTTMRKKNDGAVKQDIAMQQVSNNKSQNYDAAQIVNLIIKSKTDSELQSFLQLGNIDISEWLTKATNGMVTCSITDNSIEFTSIITGCKIVYPISTLESPVVRQNLIKHLNYIIEDAEAAQVNDMCDDTDNCSKDEITESASNNDTITEVCSNEDKNNCRCGFDREKYNENFSNSYKRIEKLMSKCKGIKRKRQTLFGQLISMARRCGHTGSIKKCVLTELLSKKNQKLYKKLYDTAA